MKAVRIIGSLVLLVVVASCGPVMVGGEQTVCDQATDHLATCGISNLPATGECSATKQRLASQILNTPCSNVDSRTSFSGSSCSSIWSLFNPGCWSSNDDEYTTGGGFGGGGPSNSGPGGDPPPKKCYCDSQCANYNDCCSNCGGGGGHMGKDYGAHCSTYQGSCGLPKPKPIGAICYCAGGIRGTTSK